uniref:Gnk2-homologous domain-containing protein n=1 Tax=Kalanchoe fedtschenkoi TaxID=63787 RepID=A0A7N0URW0_KALFE
MGFHRISTLSLLLLVVLSLVSATLQISVAAKSVDYTAFVYKGCARQGLSDPTGLYAQALAALFGALVSQSSKARFYKTTSGGGQSTVTGLFQCRGDLSNADCYNCVSKLPVMTDRLCGKVVAARVQLYGCYMLYEVAGFAQISGLEMLYRTCSATNVAGVGFAERRDMAFQVMSNGVVTNHGFFTTSYEAVYVLGQCEGDVGDADCGECVKTAIQKAQVECGSSISGQVYLHKCFISYNYYPNRRPPSSPGKNESSCFYGLCHVMSLYYHTMLQ